MDRRADVDSTGAPPPTLIVSVRGRERPRLPVGRCSASGSVGSTVSRNRSCVSGFDVRGAPRDPRVVAEDDPGRARERDAGDVPRAGSSTVAQWSPLMIQIDGIAKPRCGSLARSAPPVVARRRTTQLFEPMPWSRRARRPRVQAGERAGIDRPRRARSPRPPRASSLSAGRRSRRPRRCAVALRRSRAAGPRRPVGVMTGAPSRTAGTARRSGPGRRAARRRGAGRSPCPRCRRGSTPGPSATSRVSSGVHGSGARTPAGAGRRPATTNGVAVPSCSSQAFTPSA